MIKILFILSVCLLMTACSLPSRWAESLEKEVQCDMSLADVERLTKYKIIEEDVPREDRTHYIREGSTDVWFVFKNNKLKKIQILWAHKMMRYASYQQMNLCDPLLE